MLDLLPHALTPWVCATALLILVISSLVGLLAPASAFSLPLPRPASSGRVSFLHRYPVKGLGFDELASVSLQKGDAFPSDRRWALLKREPGREAAFDPLKPEWLHKENFYCAFTAGPALSTLQTSFDDNSETLTLREAGSGEFLLRSKLSEDSGRQAVERLIAAKVLGEEEGEEGEDVDASAAVRLVSSGLEGEQAKMHHFGNSKSGVTKGSTDIRTIHLVNLNTVNAIGTAAGIAHLSALRFRPNILVEGDVEAWEEFKWVGKDITVGGVNMRVISKTVRCKGINSVPPGDEPPLDLVKELPRLFPEHGPYMGVYCQVLEGGDIRVGDSVCGPAD